MKNDELWAELYCQRENTINGRHVWFFLLHTAIGNIAVKENRARYCDCKTE